MLIKHVLAKSDVHVRVNRNSITGNEIKSIEMPDINYKDEYICFFCYVQLQFLLVGGHPLMWDCIQMVLSSGNLEKIPSILLMEIFIDEVKK